MQDWPRNADEEDRGLFQRAEGVLTGVAVEGVTPRNVAQWAREHGMEVACAALWLAIRRSARGRGLAEVEKHAMPQAPPCAEETHLLVVPGAFYRHHKGTGADGEELMKIGRSLGWKAHRAPLKSFGPVEGNAQIIRGAVRECGPGRVVVVSLCKGSLEMRLALDAPDAHDTFKRVVGWVNLSGIVRGSPLVQWLRGIPWRVAGVHLLLWAQGHRFTVVDEIGKRAMDAPVRIPPGMRVLHVAGFPTRRALRHPWAPKAYNRLMPLGPNDGGGLLLSDLLTLPGEIYPVWGVDHYLQPGWDVTGLMRTILLQASMSQMTASATPVIKSQA